VSISLLQGTLGFDIVETHPSEDIRIDFGGFDGSQDHSLIGTNASALVHRMCAKSAKMRQS
jgi:hypothetical protein